MSRIFISHSSADNDKALAILHWMREQGWDDVFLDFDPERGLTGGASWQAQLKAAANRCEVVLLLLSNDWLASSWCMTEFRTAKMWSKAIIPIVIEPISFGDISAEITNSHQLVDLVHGEPFVDCTFETDGASQTVSFSAPGLESFRKALLRTGIDPSYFEWPPPSDPDRMPFRGLNALTAEDAGIFFGRDGQLLSALDQLRRIHDSGNSKILVILGASGSGKSSFMRAGLLPRLRRMPELFFPLNPLMPSTDALFSEEASLSSVLKQAFRDLDMAKSLGAIRADLHEGRSALTGFLSEIRKNLYLPELAVGISQRAPAIVLPIDQGEALFHPENSETGKLLLQQIEEALKSAAEQLVVLMTIRSDSYELLQSSEELEGSQIELLNLPPLARGAYGEVIKRPLQRWREAEGKLQRSNFSDELIDRILSDIEMGGAKDALPLLAFTLERLLKDYEGEAVIGLQQYRQLGGIRGAIDAAVEQTLSKAAHLPSIPQDRKAQLALLKRGFIPWLAGYDPETRTARRRVARYSEIPLEARPLIDLLVEERLLATDVDRVTGEKTIEPAHEALLRQWGSLESWIEDDQEDLTAIDGVLRAVVEWTANEQDPQWIAHTAGRLETAERAAQRPDLADLLAPTDRAYLVEARRLEDERKLRKVRGLRRQLFFATAALVVLAVAVPLLWIFWSNANAARESERLQKELALSSANVALSKLALSEGREVEAARHAFAALEGQDAETTRSAAFAAALAVSPHLRTEHTLPRDDLNTATFTGDDKLLLVWKDGGVERHDPVVKTTEIVGHFDPDGTGGWKSRIVSITEADEGEFVALRQDGQLILATEGNRPALATLDAEAVPIMIGGEAVEVSADGRYWAVIGEDNTVRTLRCAREKTTLDCQLNVFSPSSEEGFLSALALDEKASRLAVAFENGAVVLLDADTLARRSSASVDVEPISLSFLAAEPSLLFLGDRGGGVTMFETGSGRIEPRAYKKISKRAVASLSAGSKRSYLAASCDEADICLLDVGDQADGAKTVRLLTRLMGHDASLIALKWDREGELLASVDASGGLRTWELADHGTVHSEFFTGAQASVNSLALTADEAVLAAGNSAGTVFFWNLEGERTPAGSQAAPEETGSGVTGLQWAGDRTGRLAVLYDGYGIGLVTLAPSDHEVTSFHFQPLSGALRVVWSGDREVSVIAGQQPGLTFFDTGTLGQKSLASPGEQQTLPFGLATTGSHTVLTSETDGSLYRYDLANGRFNGAVKHAPVEGDLTPKAARSIALSLAKNVAGVSNRPGEIGIYDLSEETEPLVIRLPGAVAWEIPTLAFSPDGNWLAALDAASNISIWNWRGSDLELYLTVPADTLGTGRISSENSSDAAQELTWVDDTTLALATASGKVHLVSIDKMKWRQRFQSLWRDVAGN